MKIPLSLLTALLSLLVMASCGSGEPDVNVYSELHDVSKLQLAQLTVSKVGRIADPSFESAKGLAAKAEALVSKMKIGSRVGVYSYDTYISAYIDLGKLREEDVKVDKAAGTVTLRLPPIETEWDGRDFTLHEDHYRVSGLRSSIGAEERAALKERMAASLRAELAADTGYERRLRESARSRAVAYFSALIKSWGYNPVIEFAS